MNFGNEKKTSFTYKADKINEILEKNSIYEVGFSSDFGIRFKTIFRQLISDLIRIILGPYSDFTRILLGFYSDARTQL